MTASKPKTLQEAIAALELAAKRLRGCATLYQEIETMIDETSNILGQNSDRLSEISDLLKNTNELLHLLSDQTDDDRVLH